MITAVDHVRLAAPPAPEERLRGSTWTSSA